MTERSETKNFMNTQSVHEGYTASRSYLSEVIQDRLWEQNYRSGNLSKAGHEPHDDSRLPGKNSGVASEKDPETFLD